MKRKISVGEIFYCSVYYRGEVEIVSRIFYCSVYYRGDRRGDGARGRGYNTLLHLGVIHINSIFSLYLLCICSIFSLYLFYSLSTFSLHFLYICFIFLLHIFSLYFPLPPLSLYFPYIFISTLFEISSTHLFCSLQLSFYHLNFDFKVCVELFHNSTTSLNSTKK